MTLPTAHRYPCIISLANSLAKCSSTDNWDSMPPPSQMSRASEENCCHQENTATTVKSYYPYKILHGQLKWFCKVYFLQCFVSMPGVKPIQLLPDWEHSKNVRSLSLERLHLVLYYSENNKLQYSDMTRNDPVWWKFAHFAESPKKCAILQNFAEQPILHKHPDFVESLKAQCFNCGRLISEINVALLPCIFIHSGFFWTPVKFELTSLYCICSRSILDASVARVLPSQIWFKKTHWPESFFPLFWGTIVVFAFAAPSEWQK